MYRFPYKLTLVGLLVLILGYFVVRLDTKSLCTIGFVFFLLAFLVLREAVKRQKELP